MDRFEQILHINHTIAATTITAQYDDVIHCDQIIITVVALAVAAIAIPQLINIDATIVAVDVVIVVVTAYNIIVNGQ